MATPKYVRLRDGVTACADVTPGGSLWAISGNNVKEFPKDNPQAAAFVKTRLREGVLEEASRAEFDDVHAPVDEDEVVGAVTNVTVTRAHQEQNIRKDAAKRAAKQAATRAKEAKKRGSEDEAEATGGEGEGTGEGTA